MPRKKNTSDATIINAARATFLSDGIGASTKTIARFAGVSEGVLFQRFGSKQNLFFLAMRMPPPDLSHAVEASKAAPDHRVALLILARAILDYLRTVIPSLMLVMAHPLSTKVFQQHTGHAHELMLERFGLAETLENCFATYVDNQALRPRDYATVTDILLSSLITRALHEQIGLDETDDTDEWLTKVLTALID